VTSSFSMTSIDASGTAQQASPWLVSRMSSSVWMPATLSRMLNAFGRTTSPCASANDGPRSVGAPPHVERRKTVRRVGAWRNVETMAAMFRRCGRLQADAVEDDLLFREEARSGRCATSGEPPASAQPHHERSGCAREAPCDSWLLVHLPGVL
jgi:hypothetical protein